LLLSIKSHPCSLLLSCSPPQASYSEASGFNCYISDQWSFPNDLNSFGGFTAPAQNSNKRKREASLGSPEALLLPRTKSFAASYSSPTPRLHSGWQDFPLLLGGAIPLSILPSLIPPPPHFPKVSV